MATGLTIGDFSRATHLTVKTLRHYHEVGLLEPSSVDPGNGYRRYGADQIPRAQVIRRLRDLDMPIPDVQAIGRVVATVVPAVELAVVVHRGPLDGIDVTYGLLGDHIARHEIGVDGPLRETYLRGAHDTDDPGTWETEIGWPVFRADA